MRRLVQEAKSSSALNHPNIIRKFAKPVQVLYRGRSWLPGSGYALPSPLSTYYWGCVLDGAQLQSFGGRGTAGQSHRLTSGGEAELMLLINISNE
jgi:hypothetical protein